ncbi:hypothetical protein Tco_0538482, partial [Tanacetum coccineum]
LNINTDSPNDHSMTSLEETGIFNGAYDDEDVGAEADLDNLETTINVSHIPTTRIHKDHPKDQIIGDPNLATQTRRMINFSKENAMDVDFVTVMTASTPIETNKALIKDEEAEDVDVHLYISMIGSLMFQVTPKVSHLHAVKSIFRYLKGGCQFLGKRLISWQCKKHTIVANSTTEVEYVAAANCYETVYKEWEDIIERAAITASSLKVEQDSGNINRTQSMATLNEPLPQGTSLGSGPRVNTLGSGEDSMKLKELMELCIQLSDITLYIHHHDEILKYYDQHNMVALLEKTDGSEGFHQIVDFLNASHIRFVLSENPTIYDSYIKQFWQNATTPVADEVAFTSVNVVHEGAATNVSSIDVGQGSGNIPKSPTGCPMIHLSQDENLCEIRKSDVKLRVWIIWMKMDVSRKMKLIERAGQDVLEEPAKRQKIGEASGSGEEKSAKKEKELSEEELQKLLVIVPVEEVYVEALQVKYPIIDWEVYSEDTRRKRYFTAQKAEAKRNKPMTQAQQRNYMMNYIKLIGKLEVGSSKRSAEVGLDHEGSKKQKTNEASESVQEQPDEEEKELPQEDLQQMMMVVPVEEVYVEALQVKYPIINWEVYSEDTRRYWKIIRVGNHTEAYQIFADMLKKFDRDDLVKLWDLVKERFSTTEPTDDKEKELWVELKRLFEPDSDDTLWKLQRYMHDPLVWRLYDTCGVHHVSSVRGHDIFMLVEKDYPLSKGVQMLMLGNKLLVEQHSEMANELLRKIFIQANSPRQ